MSVELTTSTNILSNNHCCIGTYEDKPTNCVYYFVYHNDGEQTHYDSILEYNLFTDTITTVYQDGRLNSYTEDVGVLNFSKENPITGVNKIGDILYWTDDRNRPRKINVKLAKRNEYYINTATQFYDFYYNNNYSVVFITPNDNHEFEEGDYIYTQSSIEDLEPYNGYAEVIGIARKIPDGITFNVTSGSFNITSSSAISTNDLSVGDFVGIVHENFPRYFRVASISGTTIVVEGNAPDFTNSQAQPLHMLGVTPQRNMAGIITNCPWSGSAAMVNSNGASVAGVLLHANPEDAYSPLISFGSHHDRSKYLDVIKHQPTLRPQTELTIDTNIGKNDILDNLFQFKYRYKHYDEELTSYSGISDILIDQEFAFNTPLDYESYQRTSNAINVEYFDTISDVKQIEIVARRGNTGEFVLIDTVENNFISYLKILKNELIPDSEYQFDVPKSIIKFKNNGIYPFVDKGDSDKLFDVVPKLAKAQTILSNNRIAYGNVVEGYNNTPVVVDSQFVESDRSVDIRSVDFTFFTTDDGSTVVPSIEDSDNGVVTSAIDAPTENSDGNEVSNWRSTGNARCTWSSYIDLNPIAGALGTNQSQTFTIDISFSFKRRGVSTTGLVTGVGVLLDLAGVDLNPETKKRAGKLFMIVDLTGITTLIDAKNAIIDKFNSNDWIGGTSVESNDVDDVNQEEGNINMYAVSGNRLQVMFKCLRNDADTVGGGGSVTCVHYLIMCSPLWRLVIHL